ncbi:SCO family protein [Croceivirga thetidis]|uniref:SCO family protein n=1 Tax=Croceivirga thetidis TaxID=2721623 RepID=A0ABX1GL46_9FLAO|nr:SCO family protein [Croceivirga thetidis]NKI30617.1 SCO family protein [Croceivirga thetidis]
MPQGANKGKKYAYIWISLIILIFGVIVVPRIVERIKGNTIVENDRVSGVVLKDLDFLVNNGKKRRVPDFEFLNQDSILVSNKDLLGKVYVVDFFFTSCPTICPIMTKNLKAVQQSIQDEDFFITSFTIDPKRDTVSKLKAYAEGYNINTTNWNFLTGKKEDLYKLSNEGFYMYTQEDSTVAGGFEHSGLFALVDKKGFLRSRTDKFGNPLIYYKGTITESQGVNDEGEAQQITILKEDIKKLLAE